MKKTLLAILQFLLFGCSAKKPSERIKVKPGDVFKTVRYNDIFVDEEGILLTIDFIITPEFLEKIAKPNHRYETMYRMQFSIYEDSDFEYTSQMTLITNHDILSYRVGTDSTYTFTVYYDLLTYPTLASFYDKNIQEEIILVIDFYDDFDERKLRRVTHAFIMSKGIPKTE